MPDVRKICFTVPGPCLGFWLRFLIYEMGIMITPILQCYFEGEAHTDAITLTQRQAHSKYSVNENYHQKRVIPGHNNGC